MTYNSDMERASIGNESAKLSQMVLKSGNLAWASALISILICIFALGIAVFGAVTSGDFRSFLSHQTLTPFITAGFAIVGALVASRRPHNPIGWIFVGVGLLYA